MPAKMRTELWMSKLHSATSPASPTSPAHASYEDCLARHIDPEVLAEIEKDIHRTFPGHVTLTSPAGQRAMRDVLRAYASYDPAVGYSQGMNFIVGLLLTYLLPRHAFDALLMIMSERGLREYYVPNGMTHLQARLYQLGKLVDPELERHLEAHCVLPVLYASSWVLTCFAAEFPLKFSARVMDCVITDSFELPIMKVSVAILTRLRDEILALEDMEEIIELLRKTVPSWSEAKLMDLLTEALSSPWTARDKAVLAEECGESVADAVRRVGGGDDEGGGRRGREEEEEEHEGHRESPPAWEPEWEEAEEAPSGVVSVQLSSESTQRLSPFQSGLASGDLIDVGVAEAVEDEKRVEGAVSSLDPSSLSIAQASTMRQLLEGMSGLEVSGGVGSTKRLDALRDLVLSSSFNYSAREGVGGAAQEDEFGEWEEDSHR